MKPGGATGPVEGIFFTGKNADGLAYRSDLINPKNVTGVRLTKSDEMAVALLQHTITINTEEFANAAAISGKTVKLDVTFNQLFDYSDNNCTTITVRHKVGAGETDVNFYKALADAVVLSMPKPDAQYPFIKVTSSATGLVLTEGLQKYVRGKLTGEPVKVSVAFGIEANSYTEDTQVAWGKDTVAKSAAVLPANYVLADLEYFAFGERGDDKRGFNYPNNVEPTYAINPFSTDKYDVITIDYFWSGNAENVQKSPRTIQIACPAADSKTLFDNIKKAL